MRNVGPKMRRGYPDEDHSDQETHHLETSSSRPINPQLNVRDRLRIQRTLVWILIVGLILFTFLFFVAVRGGI